MDQVAFTGLGKLLVLLGLGSGMGLPLGMPPLPEDPVLARVAPEQCLFYASSAGTAAPDPKSINQTEQLLAEPEIQQLAAGIERQIRAALSNAAKGQGPEQAALLGDTADLGKTLLTRPAAVYVASVQVKPGQPPDVRAGLIVNLGDDAAKIRATLLKHQTGISRQAAQPVEIGGLTCYRLNTGPNAPPITWGVGDKHFMAAVGDGEMEALLQRTRAKSVPAWLAAVRKQLPVARPVMVTYLNLKTIVADFAPLGGPQVRPVLDALGLANVTWLASVTGFDETAVTSRTLLAIDGEPQGILRLATEKPLSPADLKPIPADATLALAARLDADKLLDAVLSTVGKIDPRARQMIENEIEHFPDDSDLEPRIRDNLIRSLGDVWCIYNSPGEGGLVFTGLTAVVQVKDAKRFGREHDLLLKIFQDAAEGQSPFAQVQFAGREIHFVSLGREVPFAPAWCLTDKELIVAPFPQNIKAYLSRDAKARSLATVPEVAAAFEGGGPLLLAYCDTPKLFELLYPFVPMIGQPASAELRRAGLDVNVAILPSARAIGPHLRPGVTAVRRTKAGIELVEHQSLPCGSLGSSAPFVAGLMIPAVHSARAAAQRTQSMNNVAQMAKAIHMYHSDTKSFPPAYKADKEGKPLLSWRVLILPYVNQEELYKQFHLDEPWDSEHNKKLVDKMPAIYRSPGIQDAVGTTHYLTVRGEKTAFPGAKAVSIEEISNGTSNTIMVVEAAKAVPWTKPDDLPFDEKNPKAGLTGLRPGGFIASFCDGHNQFIRDSIRPETLKALFTRDGEEAGEEAVDFDDF